MLAYITLHTAVAFGAGLIIGWNVLPQPQWVKDAWNKLVG